MSEANIRAQIKAVWEAVDGIGVVHDYIRARDEDTLATVMKGPGGKVSGVMFHRESSSGERQVGRRIEREHLFSGMAMYDLDDQNTSEKTFQFILELAFTAFAADPGLNGTAFNSAPLQIEVVELEDYGGKTYHVADWAITVTERFTV